MGSDVQHGLTKPGYMIFIRDDVAAGAKKALSVWFQDEIVLPLLREGREKAGWLPGTPIPPELQGLYWQDAQMDQNQVLKNIRIQKYRTLYHLEMPRIHYSSLQNY